MQFHILFALIIDLLLLPIGLFLSFVTFCLDMVGCTETFNPTKKNILLLHGSGFNKSEWILGATILRAYGYNVFTVNYAGWFSNEDSEGIDDYASGVVRDKILEIKQKTGSKTLYIIGHSMGALVGASYNKYHAYYDRMFIPKIISIATPWKGSVLLHSYTGPIVRYQQMKPENIFLDKLTTSVRSVCYTQYYCIGSESDIFVNDQNSVLDQMPKYIIKYFGHYAIVCHLGVWDQILKWIH